MVLHRVPGNIEIQNEFEIRFQHIVLTVRVTGFYEKCDLYCID